MVLLIIGLLAGTTLGILFTSMLVLCRYAFASKEEIAEDTSFSFSDQRLILPLKRARSV